MAEVSPERLRRFFAKEQDTYRINKSIRDLCVFARQDVVADPPFSHLDLISCRNVLIYLTPALQKRVIPTFHYALNPERVPGAGGLGDDRLVRRPVRRGGPEVPNLLQEGGWAATVPPFLQQETPSRGSLLMFTSPRHPAASADWQRAADAVVLKEYAPAGVLVNNDFDILQFRGQTGDYLAPPPGEPSHNLLKMAREGLLLAVRDALSECRRGNAPVRRTGVQIRGEGTVRETDLRVLPVKLPGSGEHCYLVLFEEPRRQAGSRLAVFGRGDGPDEPAPLASQWMRRRLSARDDQRRCRDALALRRTRSRPVCGRNSPRCATTFSPSSSNRMP